MKYEKYSDRKLDEVMARAVEWAEDASHSLHKHAAEQLPLIEDEINRRTIKKAKVKKSGKYEWVMSDSGAVNNQKKNKCIRDDGVVVAWIVQEYTHTHDRRDVYLAYVDGEPLSTSFEKIADARREVKKLLP